MSVNALNVAEPAPFLSVTDVPHRYKLTEIGIIPADWYIFSLGEISSFRTGPFGSALHRSDYIEGGIPLVNPMHIVDGEIRPAASTTVTAQAARRLAAYRFRRKDIVIGRRGDMGRCAVIGEVEDGWLCGTGSLIIRCNGNVDASFIQRTLTTERVIRAIEDASVGSTMINLNQGALARLQILCPPIIEQRAIAEALSDVDELLRALKALIAKKRAIKQGAMQQLLTGKARLPGFSGEWKSKRIGELARTQRGASPRPIDSPIWFDERSSIGWVRISDVTSSRTYLRSTTQKLSQLGVRHSRPVVQGSLLMSICATVGRPVITAVDVCIHDGFVVFEKLEIDQLFLYYLLTSIEGDWSKYGQTGSQMNLNTGLINRTAIRVPPRDEQTAIAAVLCDIDAEIAALEARRDKTRAIKQGMMQQLLTGRIRLVKPQPAEAEA